MSPTKSTDPLGPTREREWWHRHLDPQERHRVMADLAISKTPYWAYRFTIMLTLSVVVAVMGLAADSAAVVIGAMLLAPLMGPVLATAATMSMALFRKSFWSLVKVLAATTWCIALSYVLSMAISDDHLATEVLARTSPDLKDLVVALAAGAAGSYATVRKDASASLPGVAVAVALVPPLATVGIMLEAGQSAAARGALLLYVTNLAAIILASVVVFIVTGFVPPRRLATTSLRLGAATVIASAVVVAIAVPLFRASVDAAEESSHRDEALQIVQDWLGVESDLEPEIRFDEDASRLFVELKGVDYPPDDADLRDQLTTAFNLVPSIQWVRTEKATTTTSESPTTTIVTDEEVLETQISLLVNRWLSEAGVVDAQLQQLSVNFDETPLSVRVDAAGVGSEPQLTDLLDLFDAELDQTVAARVNWTERTVLPQGTVPPDPQLIQEDLLREHVTQWAETNDVTVRTLSINNSAIEIELVGVIEPQTTDLVLELIDLTDEDTVVEVFFIGRVRLETTTTIATTTTTSVAETSVPGNSTSQATTTTQG